MSYGTRTQKPLPPPSKLNLLHESRKGFESGSQRIRNSREIMMQLPGLIVATQVEDCVFLNISALLFTTLFAGGAYEKLQTP
jgi:hypothetical protein